MKKKILCVIVMALMSALPGCKGADDANGMAATAELPQTDENVESIKETGDVYTKAAEIKEDAATADSARADTLASMFGEDCIAEQTFNVELNEFDGKVYFVPLAPSADNPDFRFQIVRDGKVLRESAGYVPESLKGARFGSLDAVAFFDINFDGRTDILLIETYGNTSFAAVYSGQAGYGDDKDGYFYEDSVLSESLTSLVKPLTISGIRSYLSGGKKNGEFGSYAEAYEAVARLSELKYKDGQTYDLIYVDDDDIPELVAGVTGYFVSLYTYRDGTVYTLMDGWGYGAMGNSGYDYSPRKNSISNLNADYAGLIYYVTYMEIDAHNSIEEVVCIETFNFYDANKNGMPDDGEESDSYGNYSASYIDGREVSDEECISYGKGEYLPIVGSMDAEALKLALR